MTGRTEKRVERQIIPLPPISLRDILFVIFCKKRVFVGIWLTVIGLTLAVALVAGPIFEVTAKILVKPFVEPSLQYDASPRIMRPTPVTQEDINSEIGIMLSEDLLRNVVKKLKLDEPKPPRNWLVRILRSIRSQIKGLMVFLGLSVQPDPVDVAVENLQNRLRVTPVTLSNLFEVTLTGDSPEKITEIVNTLVDSYIDRHIKVHQTQGGETFFSKQADLFEKKMSASEGDLKEFQRKWSIGDIAIHRSGLMEVLRTLTESVALVRGKIADMSTRIEETENSNGVLNAQSNQNELIVELTKALTPLLVEQARLGELYQPASVEFQDISQQVEEMRKKIAEEQKRLIQGANTDLQGLISQEKEMIREIDRIEKKAAFLNEKEVELNRLQLNLEQNKKNYLLYQDKTEEARIEGQKEKSRVANVAVANWASAPTVPVFPKKTMMGAIAIILGAIIGVAGTFVAYYLDHTVKMPEDISRHANIPLLGAVGLIENKKE